MCEAEQTEGQSITNIARTPTLLQALTYKEKRSKYENGEPMHTIILVLQQERQLVDRDNELILCHDIPQHENVQY